MIKSYEFWYLIFRSPLVVLIHIFSFFSEKIKKRIIFEKKNFQEPGCQSFRLSNKQADLAVHISSEGELEQVLPIINLYLEKRHYVEIVFTSPSVEHKILAFYERHVENIRYLRLRILSLDFFYLKKWVSAPKIVLCRYDFFPELIFLLEKKTSILCSGTLDYENRRPFLLRNYYQWCYRQFDYIFWASTMPKNFQSHPGMIADFRTLQILKRLKNQEETLKKANLSSFVNEIKNSKKKNIIWGSFWKNELIAFKDQSIFKEITLTIAPHVLDSTNIQIILDALSKREIKVSLISEQESFKPADVYIILTKGILCELYSQYKYAIVGGGHGVSVHSVLEPYLSNCAVWCGPNVHRSTEFSYIKNQNPNRISICEDPSDYFKSILDYNEMLVEKVGQFDDNKIALKTFYDL